MWERRKSLMIVFWVLAVAIPAFASLSVADVTPEKLADGDVAYVLSVFCLFEAVVIITLFVCHRRDWIERDKLEREDRKQFRDTLNGIIAKCGGPN